MAEWLSALQGFSIAEFLATVGVRELILGLVVLVVVYMLVVVLRMKSLGAQRRFDEISAARYEADLAELSAQRENPRTEPQIPVTGRKQDRRELDTFYGAPSGIEPRKEPKNKYAEPPDELVVQITQFDQEKLVRLERDLAATRGELDALRSAFAQTRDELSAEVERLKASQRISPVYGDSMQMAMAGASAAEIASRCGIARAEAELVLSMARGGGEDAAATGGDEFSSGQTDTRGGRSRYGSY